MADRFRTPYVSRTPYQRGSLGELIARRGDIEAQGALQSGNAWANAISQVGNIAAGAFQEYGDTKTREAELKAKELAERPAREMAAERQRLEMDKLRREASAMAEADVKKAGTAEAFAGAMKSPSRTKAFEMVANDPEATKMLTESYDRRDKARNTAFGEIAATVRRFGDSDAAVAIALEDLAEEGYDAAMVAQVSEALKDPARRGMIVDSFLKSSPDEGHRALVKGEAKPDSRSLEVQLAEANASGDQAKARAILKSIGDAAKAGRAPVVPREDNEPLVPVIGADGQPVLMRRSQAEGRKPASNREQGRPVTSGDAGRLAELDNSIDLAGKLLNEMKTGTDAWLGTKVPDWLTQATGLGAESKAQNGMIKLAKQIIGKALEGGVLRKEDESKYSDILAKIEDPPEVANAKMQGLFERVKQKREFELNAREDAGYDVSKFRQRQGGGTQEGPKPPPRTPVPDSGKDPLGIRK